MLLTWNNGIYVLTRARCVYTCVSACCMWYQNGSYFKCKRHYAIIIGCDVIYIGSSRIFGHADFVRLSFEHTHTFPFRIHLVSSSHALGTFHISLVGYCFRCAHWRAKQNTHTHEKMGLKMCWCCILEMTTITPISTLLCWIYTCAFLFTFCYCSGTCLSGSIWWLLTWQL